MPIAFLGEFTTVLGNPEKYDTSSSDLTLFQFPRQGITLMTWTSIGLNAPRVNEEITTIRVSSLAPYDDPYDQNNPYVLKWCGFKSGVSQGESCRRAR